MNVELWFIDRVKPYEKNPRRNDAAVDAVARSIREFGFRQPIVVDEGGVIVVSHTRWKAATSMGLAEVPVHVAEGLTPEQARGYRIADKRLAALSSFDPELLAGELGELKLLDFDMSLLGFSDQELGEAMAPPGTVGLTDEDEVPAPPDADEAGRPVGAWQPQAVVRRLIQARGPGPSAGRGAGSSGQHGPAVQREGGAEVRRRADAPIPPRNLAAPARQPRDAVRTRPGWFVRVAR